MKTDCLLSLAAGEAAAAAGLQSSKGKKSDVGVIQFSRRRGGRRSDGRMPITTDANGENLEQRIRDLTGNLGDLGRR